MLLGGLWSPQGNTLAVLEGVILQVDVGGVDDALIGVQIEYIIGDDDLGISTMWVPLALCSPARSLLWSECRDTRSVETPADTA
jgi:hypothetical protein